MAAAEAKSRRKQSANCFPAQIDDYKAPKLTPTPSTSSTNSECEAAYNDRVLGSDPLTGSVPITTSNPTFDVKWELDMQRNFRHRKEFTLGWSNALQGEVDDLCIGTVNRTALSGERHHNIERLGDGICKEQVAIKVAPNEKSVNRTKKMDSMDEFWCTDGHFKELNDFNNFISDQEEKLASDLEFHWTGGDKTRPWWRSADKEELAFLVAQKSLENVENCDLPQPRTVHRRDYSLTSSTEMQFSSLDSCSWGTHPSVSIDKRQCILGHGGCTLNHRDQPFSNGRTGKDENISSISEVDPIKAQLLEALCHSQTRAREAEKAAQAADTEKKHIISLFLKQASQLFAYKQWFQLLQLQNICLQLNDDDQTIIGPFPDRIPRDDRELNQPRKRRKKHDNDWFKTRMYEVALAVGLGLASAGLFLGWTLGWLFPTF